MDRSWTASLRPGDLLLLRRMEPLSQLIRFIDDIDLDGRPHPRHFDASHAALYLGDTEGGHEVASVWPMPDRGEDERGRGREPEGDIVITTLDRLLEPYAGVGVFRQAEVERDLPRWLAGPWSQLREALGRRVEDAKETGTELRFDDIRMVAAGLAASWAQFGPKLTERLPSLLRKAVDGQVADLIEHAKSRSGLVCPDLFVQLFGELGDEYALLGGGVRRLATEAVEVGPALLRASIVLVCTLALDALVPAPAGAARATDAHETGPDGAVRAVMSAAFAEPNELVTPGMLVRSDRLVPICAVEGYRGLVAEGSDIWHLPRARDRVAVEIHWAPGVQPTP